MSKKPAAKPRRGGRSSHADALMSRVPIKTKTHVCSVSGCKNTEKEFPGKVFYVLPYEPDRREKWLKLIARTDLLTTDVSTDTRVCSDHFAPHSYTIRGALKSDALPTLLLPDTGETVEEESPESPTPPKLAKLAPKPRPSRRRSQSKPDSNPILKSLELSKNPQVTVTTETLEIEFHEMKDLRNLYEKTDANPDLSTESVRVKTEPSDDVMEVQSYEILSHKSRTPKNPNASIASTAFTGETQVKVEPLDEPMEMEHQDPSEVENAIMVEPVDAETQCQDRDPLALDKSELPDGPKTVATQTFSRKELYFSKASRTAAEQIDLPAPSRPTKETDKRTVILQTTANLLNCYTVPVKKALEAKIRDVNRRIKTLDCAFKKKMDKPTFLNCCEKFLDEKVVYIVQSHWHLQDKSKGNRYGDHLKQYALNLSLSNPQSYKFVEQIFNLPSKTTVKRQQTVASTGTNLTLLENLKTKVDNMTEMEKVCAMCFDVMLVNKNLWYEVHNDFLCGMQEIDQVMGPDPAEYAVVLMVRGLFTKWTQPVSFALVTEKRSYPELKEWLHKIISVMFDIGLNIKAFVCDAETQFIDVFARPETHYFEIDGRRIYHFYDVRYLFKNVRDEFMQYDFHVGPKVAQWRHILKVYDKDKKHELSLMPKISDDHVRPTAESLDDTDLAVQLFSTSVAAAMNFHVIANMAPPQVKDTVEFMAKMSNLYDMFTSSKMSNAYRGTAEQNQMLLDTFEYLQELQMMDNHGNAMESRSVIGLMVNISTMLALIEELQTENIHYLFTKILSKDCLEEFFENCRRLGGNCCERPTPIMFSRSFRRFFIESLSYNTKDGEYEQDLKSTLTKIGEHVKADAIPKTEPEFEQRKILAGVSDYKLIQWPSTEYIAGYLLWKCLRLHNRCPKLIENLSKQYDIPIEESTAALVAKFEQYNADNVDSEELPKPPQPLVDFVDRLDEKFNEYYINPDRKSVNFGLNVYRSVEQDTFELLCNSCKCFTLKFMKTLFIRLKIEFCVKDHNRNRKYQRLPRTQGQGKKQKKK